MALHIVGVGFFVLAVAVVAMPFLAVLACVLLRVESDSDEEIATGSMGREKIQSCFDCYGSFSPRTGVRGATIPPTASDFYYYEKGGFGGSSDYWSMQCATLQDCWDVLHGLVGSERRQVEQWRPSKYGVVMDGPGFYHADLASPSWDVRTIQSGAVYERVDRKNMDFYAIDFDTLRVYGHRESGGFPQGPAGSGRLK